MVSCCFQDLGWTPLDIWIHCLHLSPILGFSVGGAVSLSVCLLPVCVLCLCVCVAMVCQCVFVRCFSCCSCMILCLNYVLLLTHTIPLSFSSLFSSPSHFTVIVLSLSATKDDASDKMDGKIISSCFTLLRSETPHAILFLFPSFIPPSCVFWVVALDSNSVTPASL